MTFVGAAQSRASAIQVYSGKMVDPFDISPDDIQIGDVAASLSKLARFTGHTRRFYSVAQHSVLVSRIVPPEDALAGLLHDAAEAYTGDVSRPVKQYLNRLTDGLITEIELRIEAAVAFRFGFPFPLPASVKRADNVLLATEKRDLMNESAEPWAALPEPLPEEIVPWDPPVAEVRFLERFHQLYVRP